MKYVCLNSNCKDYLKEEEFIKEKWVFSNGHLTGVHCQCPKCGLLRKEINPNKDIPLSEKNIGISTFSRMSPERRREELKKRSHQHFQKKVKERKDGLLNQAISEMKDIKTGKL